MGELPVAASKHVPASADVLFEVEGEEEGFGEGVEGVVAFEGWSRDLEGLLLGKFLLCGDCRLFLRSF